MAITRTAWIDDDGSGTTGTVINNAEKTLLYDQIDAALVSSAVSLLPGVSTVTTTGAINALPLPIGTGDLRVYMNNAAPATINGVSQGTNGQRLTIIAVNALVTFPHLSGAATGVTNRLWNLATSAPTPISGSGIAEFIYDGQLSGLWRMVAHEQGAWIAAPFSAANFVGSGGATWTVDAGDVIAFRYRLSGRTLQVYFQIQNTSLSTAGANACIINGAAFGGFTTASVNAANRLAYATDNGVMAHCHALTATGTLNLHKFDYSNFAASVNNTTFLGEVFFDVT